ncbi:hypothetical protein ACFL6Y_06685 [Elusimicrobiota bacterium]
MKISIRKGFGFGLTSGIITTLGLIMGLHSSTHSSSVIIGGILVIAIADAMSDALGMHISEECEHQRSTQEIWESTIATFLSKFIFALTFLVPMLTLPLSTAIIISIIWGLSLISIFSYYIAKKQCASPYHVVLEHLVIAVFVIAATHYVGDWIASFC